MIFVLFDHNEFQGLKYGVEMTSSLKRCCIRQVKM